MVGGVVGGVDGGAWQWVGLEGRGGGWGRCIHCILLSCLLQS